MDGLRLYQTTNELDAMRNELLRDLLERFGGDGLSAERIAITLVLPDGRGFGHRSAEPIYPASVVKLLYLAAVHAWLDAGRLQPTAELDRALDAMIRISSNDATNYVVDLLTGTTGGPELAAQEMAVWMERRDAVNRWLGGLGWPELKPINATQKTWDEGPYGREQQSRRGGANRNLLTTDATARLLWAIDRGEAVSPERSAEMLALLARDPRATSPDEEDYQGDQVRGFFGEGLPEGAKLWSKAGWTSDTRHDAAIVELEGGPRFILAAFTEGRAQARNKALLPSLAERIVRSLG